MAPVQPLTEVETAPASSADLKVKTAWLYYVEGLTQQEIARRLNLHRIKVMRLLAACAEEGIVVTTIHAASAELVALERKLETRYGLQEAVVVPAPADPAHLEKSLGQAIAGFLAEQMRDGMTLAVGGGATLYASLGALPRRSLRQARVVSLVGGLPHSRWINPSIVAIRLAEVFGCDSYTITAPVLVDGPDAKEVLWRQAAMREVQQQIAAADITLLTVGGVDEDATVFRHEIIPSAMAPELRRAGAVANLLCQFVDAQGRLVEHEVNQRIMAADLASIANARRVVLAAGGGRVEAIRAGLAAVKARALITDAATAQALTQD